MYPHFQTECVVRTVAVSSPAVILKGKVITQKSAIILNVSTTESRLGLAIDPNRVCLKPAQRMGTTGQF